MKILFEFLNINFLSITLFLKSNLWVYFYLKSLKLGFVFINMTDAILLPCPVLPVAYLCKPWC